MLSEFDGVVEVMVTSAEVVVALVDPDVALACELEAAPSSLSGKTDEDESELGVVAELPDCAWLELFMSITPPAMTRQNKKAPVAFMLLRHGLTARSGWLPLASAVVNTGAADWLCCPAESVLNKRIGSPFP